MPASAELVPGSWSSFLVGPDQPVPGGMCQDAILDDYGIRPKEFRFPHHEEIAAIPRNISEEVTLVVSRSLRRSYQIPDSQEVTRIVIGALLAQVVSI